MAGDYEIIQAVHIGDREIVVGENQADEQGLPYLVQTQHIGMISVKSSLPIAS